MTHSQRTLTVLLVATAMVMSLALIGCLEPEDSTPDPEDETGIECGDEALFALIHDSCEPMDAAGDNECYCMLGYAWTGSACEAVTGCECTGDDCDSLSETEEDCLDAHATCVDDTPEDISP